MLVIWKRSVMTSCSNFLEIQPTGTSDPKYFGQNIEHSLTRSYMDQFPDQTEVRHCDMRTEDSYSNR